MNKIREAFEAWWKRNMHAVVQMPYSQDAAWAAWQAALAAQPAAEIERLHTAPIEQLRAERAVGYREGYEAALAAQPVKPMTVYDALLRDGAAKRAAQPAAEPAADDLVKRLRGGVYGLNRIPLCEEAANALERLHAERERDFELFRAEMSGLAAENKVRLKALEWLILGIDQYRCSVELPTLFGEATARAILREARKP